MGLIIERKFPPASPEMIAAFEDKWDIKLPEQFKNFLLQWNGGSPKPKEFAIPPCKQAALVDYLFGIAQPGELGDLQTEYLELLDEMPEGFLPIGLDPGGNLLLLATIGKNAGRVYYWDAVHFFDMSDEEHNTYLVAEDMNAFLASLH